MQPACLLARKPQQLAGFFCETSSHGNEATDVFPPSPLMVRRDPQMTDPWIPAVRPWKLKGSLCLTGQCLHAPGHPST